MHVQRHLLFLVLLVAVYGCFEVGTLVSTRSKFRAGSRDLTFYAVTIPGMLSLWAPFLCMFLRVASLPVYVAGIAVMVFGAVTRVRGVSELQGFFSTVVEKLDGHVLIDQGLHAYIRHPAYLGTLLMSFSVVVASSAPWWIYLFPLLTVAGVLVRIRKEEGFLAKSLPGYDEYMKKTRRLIPGVF